jgi:hypothetical protein
MELKALKLGLKLDQESRVSHLQIYGDSLLFIQWILKEITLRNFTIEPLFNEVLTSLLFWSQIILLHIYRKLFKAGIEVDQGIWMVKEGNTLDYEKEPRI